MSQHPIHKWRGLLLPTAIIAVALLGLAATALAGVANSKHDFSSNGSGGMWGSADQQRVCVFCHTPHNAQAGAEPLWNRAPVNSVFNVYTSTTLNATVGQPGGNSKLCLSCHDGSVAIDAYVAGNPNGTPQMMAIGDVYYSGSPYGDGGANIGGNYTGNANVNDLTNDHPISFNYDDALASSDGGLKAASLLPASLPLFAQKVECATCHDVHNKDVVSGTKLLRVTAEGSLICLSCHIK